MSDQTIIRAAAAADAASVESSAENAILRAALAEAQRRIEELEGQGEGDRLTGLANARRFAAAVERVAGLAQRHRTQAAIVLIDLRGLGAINDAHGRLAGDSALVHVGRLLSGLIRTTDLLARTGGSEFGLLLDHLDADSAIDTAERLAHCIAASPLDLGHAKVPLRAAAASAAILPGDAAPEIMMRAARNLAHARAEG
jgi:diguanylate cyclase (GGDEF)-like protein